MTLLEVWGCALISFGPALAMFSLTVAHDPIKVILLVSSSFFWLMSFLAVAICWAVISNFCDYLIVGAILAVLSQEAFRYLFHLVIKKAQFYLDKILSSEEVDRRSLHKSSTSRANEIQIGNSGLSGFQERVPLSYVSGLGFGLMNGAFSLMNILTDHLGPGSVGLKGDSTYFLLVSSLTALAFILLNVSWSIMMGESIDKSDKKLAAIVVVTHLAATLITLINKFHLQLVSILVVYSLTIFCGLGAFQVAGLNIVQLVKSRSSINSDNQ